MCERIYLCHICLWPICFPFGQKMHLGTGWYCWREHQAEYPAPPTEALRPFRSATEPEALAVLADRAVELYEEWKEGRGRDIVALIGQSLREGRPDVVHEFLKRLQRDEQIGRFLITMTRTRVWRQWSRAR